MYHLKVYTGGQWRDWSMITFKCPFESFHKIVKARRTLQSNDPTTDSMNRFMFPLDSILIHYMITTVLIKHNMQAQKEAYDLKDFEFE